MVASNPWQWNSAWQRKNNKKKQVVFLDTCSYAFSSCWSCCFPMLILHVVEIGPLWTLCRDSYLRLQHLHPSMFPMPKVEQAAKTQQHLIVRGAFTSIRYEPSSLQKTLHTWRKAMRVGESRAAMIQLIGKSTSKIIRNLWFCMAMISDSFFLIPKVFGGSPATPYTSSP